MSCYSENEIVPIVLEIIKNNPGIRTSDLIGEARRIMQPSGDDTINNETDTIGERNRQWYIN